MDDPSSNKTFELQPFGHKHLEQMEQYRGSPFIQHIIEPGNTLNIVVFGEDEVDAGSSSTMSASASDTPPSMPATSSNQLAIPSSSTGKGSRSKKSRRRMEEKSSSSTISRMPKSALTERDRQLLKSLKSIRRRVRETKELVYRGEPPPASNGTVDAKEKKQRVEWVRHQEARESFIHYFTFLYAFVVLIYLIVEEATHEEYTGDYPVGVLFHCYMYGVAINFLCYVHLFVINPSMVNRILSFISKQGWWSGAERFTIIPASQTAETVSTIFLRIGTLLFGCAGVVLYGLELYLLFEERMNIPYFKISVCENLHGAVFVLMQLHFLNVNYKVLVQTSRNICRFGFMHCFAVNIWLWYRFAQAKASKTLKKQIINEHSRKLADDIQPTYLPSNWTVTPYDTQTSTISWTEAYLETKSSVPAVEHFGYLASFLNTCLIEYTVIGATVMFVFWIRLDPSYPVRLRGEKNSHRFDFGSSRNGFFLGVVLFICGAVLCGVYAGAIIDHDHSFLLLGAFECLAYSSCILAVITAMIFMRSLVLSSHGHSEAIDLYLLFEGFCGEAFWCSAELARFIDVGGDVTIFAVVALRLAHVFMQTWFILTAFKLEFGSTSKATAMIGKQCVTFMLVANVTLFFFHVYESMTEGFGYVSSSTSNYTYVKLLALPMIAFYRFHCSVCLAEVWEKTFARPRESGRDPDVHLASSTPSIEPTADIDFHLRRCSGGVA